MQVPLIDSSKITNGFRDPAFTTASERTYLDFANEFAEITGLLPSFDEEYTKELARLLQYLSSRELRSLDERRREFLGHVNWKFRLNSRQLAKFYSEAAGAGFTFHYHQKRLIQRAFDLRNPELLAVVLGERLVPEPVKSSLLRLFAPIDERSTLEHLANECKAPSKLRKEKGDRDIEREIIKALFSAFMWVSLPEREMHRFFDPHYTDARYSESFWELLHGRSPHLFNRDNALHVVRISQDALHFVDTAEELRNAFSALIKQLYEVLNNYGVLAILVEPINLHGRQLGWELAAGATLFAEKHRELPLKKAYFRWQTIREQTAAYIPELDITEGRFELANEGFSYRDCFVLASRSGLVERLLLVFQKNERDETPIPCPACRSACVQGNSYSSLGVRSWECNNVLCPDRSKYNRGKRYSFRGLLMQQAIDDDRSEIPVESVRHWTRDVVVDATDNEIAEMLVRHYSMYGDGIHSHDWPIFEAEKWGRRVKHHELELRPSACEFWAGPFFRRYVVPSRKRPVRPSNLGDDNFQVLLGDSAEVLRSLSDATFDGAVTSPPYYNAREYAQWPNIYCYLRDMFDINREVFRTLKPGALYLYNVFDYFDNENTTVFSAMGQRRLPLSAYTVDLFRRIGFELSGNIVWDKGDIEGKRGFNAGNFSPYYQAPFNCWEHVLIFRRPAENDNCKSTCRDNGALIRGGFAGSVLQHQPVMKMVRGENTHGHSAPFPDAIAELLVSQLPDGAVVLDPFGGSLTTGRVAERYGLRSVCIERSEKYCRLGLRMRTEGHKLEQAMRSQLALF
jgi:DNA modification methylase